MTFTPRLIFHPARPLERSRSRKAFNSARRVILSIKYTATTPVASNIAEGVELCSPSTAARAVGDGGAEGETLLRSPKWNWIKHKKRWSHSTVLPTISSSPQSIAYNPPLPRPRRISLSSHSSAANVSLSGATDSSSEIDPGPRVLESNQGLRTFLSAALPFGSTCYLMLPRQRISSPKD